MPKIAPDDYICPICLALSGVESDLTLLRQNDLVFKDNLVSVWINSFWITGNEGHVIITPNQHFESLYDLPATEGNAIFAMSQKVCQALKDTYQCDGITLRQNNEPAGDQHAFHYHLHVYPRYTGDSFNQNMSKSKNVASPSSRLVYAQKLRDYWAH